MKDVNERMTAIADAIRLHTLKSDNLGLNDMIKDLAEVTGYDISDIEGQLQGMTLDDKYTVMAEAIRYATGGTALLSLDDMASEIRGWYCDDAVAKIGVRHYATLDDAIASAQAGNTIKLLKDITLENVTEHFAINKLLTIDGAKADGSGKYKITADVTATTLVHLFQANADFTMQNVDVNLTSEVKSGVIRGGTNITIKNCNFDTQYRAVTFFRASVDKYLSISNSNIVGGNCVLYLYQCSGGAEIVDNSLIECRGDVSDDGKSAVYVSGCNNKVAITVSTIKSENIGIQINKVYCNLYLGEHSTIQTTTDHAIYTHGVGVSIDLHFAQTAYVESSENNEPYFTENTAEYTIEFAEEYERYAMCSGEPHSSGSGGLALEFFDDYTDAIYYYFGILFTYRAEAANEFAANGHTVYETKDIYDVTYYLISTT